jgi:hypothetical protein
MKRLLSILALSILVLSNISCISSTAETDEKRISIFFSVFNIGENITTEQDTIRVSDFKFTLTRFNLYAEGDVILQSTGDVGGFIFAYTDEITVQRLILDVGLGFSDIENFTGYEIFFEPVGDNSNIGDAEFFGTDENYSQVIRGTVNDVDFVFKSSFAFEKLYEITGVQLNDREETLVVATSINLEDVFVDEDGNFLDPTVEENELLIMQNIERNLIANFGSESVY